MAPLATLMRASISTRGSKGVGILYMLIDTYMVPFIAYVEVSLMMNCEYRGLDTITLRTANV